MVSIHLHFIKRILIIQFLNMRYSFSWLVVVLFASVTSQAQVLDETFGTDGLVTTDVNPNLNIETLQALLVLENQQILAGGTDNTNGFIVRYNQNGTLDTTFQNNGILQLPVMSILNFIQLSQTEFYILALKKGTDSYYNFVIGKMDANGNLDTTFGTNGLREYNLGTFSDDVAADFTLQPDGNMVVVGHTSFGNNSLTQIFVARLLPNGDYDTTFSTDGKVFVEMIDHRQRLNAVSILPDGRIVGTGEVTLTTGSNQNRICAVRLLANGNLDTTFSEDGYTYFNIETIGASGSDSHVLMPDNSLIIGGSCYSPNNPGVIRNFALVKLTESGEFDTTFGTQGKVISLIPSHYSTINQLVQYESHLFAVGYSYQTNVGNENFTLAKYTLDGTQVNDFGEEGFLITDFFGFADFGYKIIISSDEILTAGFASTSSFPSNRYFALARYTDDNSLQLSTLTNPSTVVVYPTVFSETIQLQAATENQTIATIYDYTGKKIHSAPLMLTQNPTSLDLNKLAPGAYLLQLNLQNGETVHVEKIFKR